MSFRTTIHSILNYDGDILYRTVCYAQLIKYWPLVVQSPLLGYRHLELDTNQYLHAENGEPPLYLHWKLLASFFLVLLYFHNTVQLGRAW